MNIPRHIRFLFLLIGVVVSALLCWSGYQMLVLTQKVTHEQVEQAIQKIAVLFQYKNFTDRNMAGLYSKEDADARLAFAAGITRNKGKIAIFFDTDTGMNTNQHVPRIDMRQMAAQTRFDPDLVHHIDQYEMELNDSLSQLGIGLRYTLHREQKSGECASAGATQSYTSTSAPFIINVLDPVVYHIDYSVTGRTLFLRMLPFLLTGLLILSLVLGACILYARSYKIQQQMIRFREALFSNITHELKTPLSSLQLILENVKPDISGEQMMMSRDHNYFAHSELRRMQLLIDKILAFGKMNHNQFALNKTYVQPDEIIREAVEIIRINTNPAKITYTGGPVCAIVGDRILLVNLLTTLLDNAIKYNRNVPEVEIRMEESRGQVVIRIKDNGIGISAVYHHKIFTPFFRVPTGNIQEVKGHGLGLSFARQVIDLHKGSISLTRNTPDPGTTFIITFPSGSS